MGRPQEKGKGHQRKWKTVLGSFGTRLAAICVELNPSLFSGVLRKGELSKSEKFLPGKLLLKRVCTLLPTGG